VRLPFHNVLIKQQDKFRKAIEKTSYKHSYLYQVIDFGIVDGVL